MSENLKRTISGIVYITLMWVGTSYSSTSFAFLFGVLGIFCIYEMWKLRKGKTKLVAFIYVLLPFSLIQLFGITNHNYANEEFNPSIILLLFILTWTFDTFAYIFGVKFGKRKILPSISPKKSWEGFLGGFLFCFLAGFLSQYFFRSYFENIPYKTIVILSLILPFTATIGDFIESHFKRQAKVKDSGSIMPGHGGILDRMDAFMVTIPVLYLLINLVK